MIFSHRDYFVPFKIFKKCYSTCKAIFLQVDSMTHDFVKRRYLRKLNIAISVIGLLKYGLCFMEFMIGVCYRLSCPLQQLIPFYLCVSGFMGMFYSLFLTCLLIFRNLFRRILPGLITDNYPNTDFAFVELATSLICSVWQIAGSTIVFSNKILFDKHYMDTKSTFYCRPLVYNTAFYTIIVRLSLVPFLIAIYCVVRKLEIPDHWFKMHV